jgi:hypothetical protein
MVTSIALSLTVALATFLAVALTGPRQTSAPPPTV